MLGPLQNQSQSINSHAGKTCNYYGKLCHIVANNWKLKNNKEKEGIENKSRKPATADCVVESESDGDMLVTTMSLATTSGKGVDDDCFQCHTPPNPSRVKHPPRLTGLALKA